MKIYKITNNINNKIYIGQTTRSIKKRWLQHCREGSSCSKLSNAIKKYGKENFTIEIIDKASSLEELNKKEVYWIDKLESIEKGYNLTTGGLNAIPSKETRKKLSKSGKIAQNRPEVKEKLSKSGKIAQNRPEVLARSVETAKEMWKDPEVKNKIKKSLKNKWSNKEFKEENLKKLHECAKKARKKPFNVYKAIKKGSSEKGNFVGSWENQIDCAKDLGVDYRNLPAALKKKIKQYKGYVFEYCTGE